MTQTNPNNTVQSKHLEALFSPRSVAILGASRDPKKRGNLFVRNLVQDGFPGQIYPINPSADEIQGVQAYPSIEAIDAPVDLVLNALNPQHTPKAIVSCAQHGVPFSLIFTAGFAETGDDGTARQLDMVTEAQSYGMRIVGPNSMGMFNLDASLNLTSGKNLERGPISIISQSGNVAISLWHQAKTLDIGFSKFVGVGNQADIALHEYLDYLGDDPNTAVIVMYVEAIKPGHGAAFLETARRVSTIKPIVMLKGGRTENGQRAAASHTASMASSLTVFNAAMEQAGIILVDDLDELLPIAETLYRCPPFRGNRAAVIGSGGGHSILSVDAMELNGFEVIPFSDATKSFIEPHLPSWAYGGNPVDMTGAFMSDLTLFARFAGAAHIDPKDYGGTLAFGLYGMWGEEDHVDKNGLSFETAAPLLGQEQARSGKPIVFYTPYATQQHPAFTAMRRAGVPCFSNLSLAAKALAALRYRAKWDAPAVKTAPSSVTRNKDLIRIASTRLERNLTEVESYQVLAEYGINIVPFELVRSHNDAWSAAERLGLPVVMKISSPEFVHKSDVGGVIGKLVTKDEVRRAYQQLASIAGSPEVLVTKYRPDSIEVIAGIKRDEVFGPCLLVGSGGVFAEALEDFAVLALPTSQKEVESAIRGLKAFPVIEGHRGHPGVELSLLTEELLKLADLALANASISEIDLNPILCRGEVVEAADARIIVAKGTN